MSTPHAAAFAGVVFAVLFGVALVLIRTALPEGAEPGSQWIDGATTRLRVASVLMPFAGIAFLWFIGVVRDGFGRYEDRFFATVFLGSGILFLATMFVSSAIGAGLIAARAGMTDGTVYSHVATFGQMVLMALSKTYGVRMAAVFMISLATIWLKTGLMPRPLVYATYLFAVALLIGGDVSMWIVLAFPVWVLAVSLLILIRAGVIDLPGGEREHSA
ncbi:hypothetical protein A5740_04040 [Mycobacterium sp. GA-1841]|uniref:hypothetical protein n=1 Tax=Mycobacterium sp. GA-1841 TaxID=1834154 RepID=UPI00096D213F|nr:hypothetical protein [Mycobacterium sp. GA-1841]OMC37981.1 hypothetical protein A5740_04040 [Mycobacterium sp. GA-1841]